MDDFRPCEYPELPVSVSGSILYKCFSCFVPERMLLGKESWYRSALCTLHLQLLPSRIGALWNPGWAELQKQDYKLHSCAIATSYISDNEHFAARDLLFSLGTSATWIWIMSTVVAFLLNNHQSSGWQWTVGLSEVQSIVSSFTSWVVHLTPFNHWTSCVQGVSCPFWTFCQHQFPSLTPIPQIVAAAQREARQRHMGRC